MVDSPSSNYYKNSLVFKTFMLGKIILFGSIVLSISCGSSLKVDYDYDTEKDFTQFKTYDFINHPSHAHAREYVVKNKSTYLYNRVPTILSVFSF